MREDSRNEYVGSFVDNDSHPQLKAIQEKKLGKLASKSSRNPNYGMQSTTMNQTKANFQRKRIQLANEGLVLSQEKSNAGLRPNTQISSVKLGA
jgi:hypothetical protein